MYSRVLLLINFNNDYDGSVETLFSLNTIPFSLSKRGTTGTRRRGCDRKQIFYFLIVK